MTTVRINYAGTTMDGTTSMSSSIEPVLENGVYVFDVPDVPFGAFDPGLVPPLGQSKSLNIRHLAVVPDVAGPYAADDEVRIIGVGRNQVPPVPPVYYRVAASLGGFTEPSANLGLIPSGLCLPVPRGYEIGFACRDKGPYMIQMTFQNRKPQRFRCVPPPPTAIPSFCAAPVQMEWVGQITAVPNPGAPAVVGTGALITIVVTLAADSDDMAGFLVQVNGPTTAAPTINVTGPGEFTITYGAGFGIQNPVIYNPTTGCTYDLGDTTQGTA